MSEDHGDHTTGPSPAAQPPPLHRPSVGQGYRAFDSAAAFSEGISALFVPTRVHGTTAGFRARARSRSVDDVQVTHVQARRHEFHHAGAWPGWLIAVTPLSGGLHLSQGAGSARLHPGQLALTDTARPHRIGGGDDFDVAMIRFPTRALDIPADALETLTATPVGDPSTAAVVTGLYRALALHADALDGPAGTRLTRAAVDLTAALVRGALPPPADPAALRRHRLRRDAEQDIAAHLTDRDLGPRTIAARLHVSPRTLQALFADETATVSGYIRSQRLVAARSALSDELRADITVSRVAADLGFADAPHLSRLFKAAFGESPGAYRARVLAARRSD